MFLSTSPVTHCFCQFEILTGKQSYFCREYLEGYFRGDPTHAQFIDWDLVEEYYGVGGVRIEDCILVTEAGHENLTVAPKGDELLDVINKSRK
jgi:Xaa-Pro dipeptidase